MVNAHRPETAGPPTIDRHLATRWADLATLVVAGAVLAIGLFYTSLTFRLPNHDLPFDKDWSVQTSTNACLTTDCLREGDQIVAMDGVSRAALEADLLQPILLDPDRVPMQIQRGARILDVVWIANKPPPLVVVEKLMVAAFPMLFWLLGLMTVIFVRPRDLRWLLLVGMYFGLSLLLSSGLLSWTRQAGSSLVLHLTALALPPLLVHLHTLVPTAAYRGVRRTLVPALYAVAVLGVLAERIRPLPTDLLMFAVVGGLAISATLLVGRLMRADSAAERAGARLLVVGGGLGMMPWMVLFALSGTDVLAQLPYDTDHLVLMALATIVLPLWPMSYLLAIYRLEFGRLELRANRALGVYGFWSLFILLYVVVFFLIAARWEAIERQPVLAGLLFSIAFLAIAPAARRRFQTWIDRSVMGIRVPPQNVIGAFAEEMPSAFDRESLRATLLEKVLPSLLVRQSAMVEFEDLEADARPVYLQEVNAQTLPTDPRVLLTKAETGEAADSALDWVRVALPMRSGRRTLGVWLFGRRDPDDAYPRDDVRVLRHLANQISLVLRAQMQLAENRRLQSQLVQSQKMEAIGRLSAGLAHDFNNLLSAILGYSDLLRPSVAAPQERYLAGIREAGERAAALTSQLLAFSRQQVIAPKIVSLWDLVVQLQSLLRRLIGEDIEIRLLDSPSDAYVDVDPGQIEQVLLNLAVNASDAMPNGGVLELSVRAIAEPSQRPEGDRDTWVRLRVRDTGQGIQPEILDRIFEPFFTTKETGRGTGLGLSMVYGTVRQSGGRIAVDSTPNEGTTFDIFLPAVPAADVRDVAPVATEEAIADGRETILLVEDEASVRLVVHEMLRSRGYRVLQAADGVEALDLFAAHRDDVDLLLTDVMMPRLKGPQLAERLRELDPDLRVVYMSGYSEDTALVRPITGGGDGPSLLRKPFRPGQLAQELRRTLDRPLAETSRAPVDLGARVDAGAHE